MVPSVPPRPPVIDEITSAGFIPVSKPSINADNKRVINGFHLYLEINTIRKTMAINVHTSKVALWDSPNRVLMLYAPSSHVVYNAYK
ncbi:hypothetical protein D3C75_1132060 [compost metagenome]